MLIPHFLYPVIWWWIFGWFPPSPVGATCTYTHVPALIRVPALRSFGCIPKSGIAGLLLYILRNCHTFPQQLNRFTVSPAVYKAPVSPHPGQNLFPFIWVVISLVDVKM